MPDLVGTWRLVAAKSLDAGGSAIAAAIRTAGNRPHRVHREQADDGCALGRARGSADGHQTRVRRLLWSLHVRWLDLDHAVDAAPNPALIGTAQARGVRFEGERMVLKPPPREIDGVLHHRELIWERISPV